MTKRVFLIHGWGGGPDNDWFPWVKSQLEQKGFQVHAPVMPDTEQPKIGPWVSTLSQEVGKPEHTDILIGHSIGCQTILRYLETLEEGTKVDKVIFIAGWHTLSPESIPGDEEKEIAKPWIETPIDYNKVKDKANSFIALFSDNDPDVPFEENNRWLKASLEVSTVLVKGKGHFTESEGVKELPEVLKFL